MQRPPDDSYNAFPMVPSKLQSSPSTNRSTRLVEKSTRLDRLDRLVDDFSINSTWRIFDRLDRLHRSTTGLTVGTPTFYISYFGTL